MGHHKDNGELREERDEVFAETDGEVDDSGSQDERRKEGLGPA